MNQPLDDEIDRGLQRARVLVELAWIPEAEVEVARLLEVAPDSLDAWSLLAKIKHIKGELSQTIACWAQIHERSTAESRAWFEALSAARGGADQERHKLAVLAGAWFAERTGDAACARVELEELGRERGFEHDPDRLLALVRVYDRIGTPACLEAAARICRHVLGELERRGIEKLSILGHLAALERRAGRPAVAAELDARFLDATRRRMHRASLHDLVRVAAREYLPIAQLRTVRPAGDHVPRELDRREHALAAVLRGEHATARRALAGGRDRIDRQYLAELDAIAGDDARAIASFLDTIGDGEQEPAVVGWLLDRSSRSRAIASYWSDPDRRDRTRALLEAQLQLAPQRPELWRRLAALHELAGRSDDGRRCAARAGALAAQGDGPIGRVLAASVYHLAGRPKGLLHEIWVHRLPTAPGRGGTLSADAIFGNVTADLRNAIRNTFAVVREYVRARLPDLVADLDDYTYTYKLPKEDEPSGGTSAGLPSALAFLSVFLQRPITRTIASSGATICEAHDVVTIGRIGEAEHKVKAAYHGNLCTLILPLANRDELEQSTLVPLAITRELVRYAADLDQAARLAFGADVFTGT